MAHSFQRNVHGMNSSETDDIDRVDSLLNKTGCADLHYQVQDCFAETRDWRKCQTEVRNFRDCMNMYEKKKKQDGKT